MIQEMPLFEWHQNIPYELHSPQKIILVPTKRIFFCIKMFLFTILKGIMLIAA